MEYTYVYCINDWECWQWTVVTVMPLVNKPSSTPSALGKCGSMRTSARWCSPGPEDHTLWINMTCATIGLVYIIALAVSCIGHYHASYGDHVFPFNSPDCANHAFSAVRCGSVQDRGNGIYRTGGVCGLLLTPCQLLQLCLWFCSLGMRQCT